MKTLAFLIAIFALGATLFAGEKSAAPLQLLSANGDVSTVNVSADSVAQRTWITLNTNANYKVLCQVYYEDNLNPDPSEPDEIEYARYIEDFLNFCLGAFLADRYGGLPPDALVREYRSGKVRAALVRDFPEWFRKASDETNAENDGDIVSVDVLAVTMRAVGPFAKAIAE